jgi:four helix bundle protein
MSVESEQLKDRTRAFGISVLRLVDRLRPTTGTQVVARQLARSATSVGANYRAACTARSRAEFIAKLGVANEEVDESVHWLEIIGDVPYLSGIEVQPLLQEAVELRAIIGRSLGTARRNDQK